MLLFPTAMALLLYAIWSPVTCGQTFFGSISGTVLDATGAAVPAATVTLTNLGTSEKRTMQSDTAGSYTFVNLVPGRYRIEAERSGFKRFTREPIVVEVQSAVRIDIPMELGAVTQTVEVTAATPLLQPQTSDLGQVVAGRSVTDIPLNGRNPLALVSLVPGVVPQGNPSNGNAAGGNPVGANPFAFGDFQIGGGQAGQSAIYMDGAPVQGSYLNVVTVIPTQDAVQEFKVQTNNLGPEWGRFAGGVINLTTKSGTNAFHGSAYEFLRNKVLDANDFFLNRAGQPVPPFTQNQFGANIGGRIIRDKLFFFSSYEGFRQRLGAAVTGTVPTEAMRNGDFSDLRDASGNVIPIYDPLTTCGKYNNPPCATPGVYTRQQFSYNGQPNVIPPDRIDPTANILKTYWPAPTSSGDPFTHNNNYTTAMSVGGNFDQINERVDFNISDKQRFFARFTYWTMLDLPKDPFKNGICPDRCTETYRSKPITLGDTYSFSPTTILDVRLGYARFAYLRTPLTQGIDLGKFGPDWAPLNKQVAYTHIPAVCPAGYTVGWCTPAVGVGSGIGAHDDTWSLTPSLTKIKGAHTFKMGADLRLLRNNYYQSNSPSGEYDFDNAMTSANALSASPTGNSFASFLLGYGSGGGITTPSFMASQLIYRAFYFGDTFQVSRNFTLNLGIRYDVQGSWSERFDRQVVLLPDATSPLSSAMAGVTNPATGRPFGTIKGAFTLVNTPAHPSRATLDQSWTNFQPRFGLAYRWKDKTVIRGGYGLIYLGKDVAWNDAPHNMFINTFFTPWLYSLDGGITPNNVLSNPFPNGIILPPGRNQAWIDRQGGGLEAPVSNNPLPYVQQWNFNIQRELPDGTLVDLAYAGSKGTHLPMHDQSINQLTPAYLPAPDGGPGTAGYDVAALKATVANPFYGLIDSGNLSASTVQAAHLLLPFPQYDNLSIAEPDNRDSTYHSMQLKVEKRFRTGGTILASYTVAKLISNTNSELNWLEAAAPSWGDSNAYNIRGEKSLDGFDVSQRFVVSYVLDLPFGKGKRWGNSLNPVASKLVSGWGINGITTFQTGFPLSIGGSGVLSSVPSSGSPRATRTGVTKPTQGSNESRLGQWFDTSVFTPTSTYTYGNDSRTEPNLRWPGMNNFDFALFKNTRFGPEEKLGLEFRAEFFNLFNRPQFSPPDTACCRPEQGGSNSNFGVISAQYNLPRVIQFGLRLTF
jgi:hypothetical protein